MWKITILIISVFLINTLSAQERILLRSNGEQVKISNSKNLQEAITETKMTNLKGKRATNVFPKLKDIYSQFDTVSYRDKGEFRTNFGFLGQDVMMMWFEAPADMTIKGIGFTCSDDEGSANATYGLRLIRLNWTKEKLKSFNQATYMGYYPSANDRFNASDYFGEEASGEWISKDSNNPLPPWTNHENPDSNTFDYDLWKGDGMFEPPTVVASDVNNPIYNWLDLASTGLGTADVVAGEIFGVVATHDGTTLDSDRIGFWSEYSNGYPGWKYYENGMLSSDEPGWWIRMVTWDFAVAVDITGDSAPKIVEVTELQTTYWEEPREVFATIVDYNEAIGGEKGVESATLFYKIDDNEFVEVQMSNLWNNNYSATIPKQFRGTEVEYYIKAIDVTGNESESKLFKYSVFKPTSNILIILNGFETLDGYPQEYYFYKMDEGEIYVRNYLYGDYWAYGPVPEELINRYLNVFEITTSGPLYDNTTVIRNWLEAASWHEYFLAGDEWLSYRTNSTNTTFSPGSFEYDILGITEVFNNIAEPDTFSLLYPQEASILGDSLYRAMIFNFDETIHYNPNNQVGSQNYLDGFNVLPDFEVDMKAKGKDGNIYNVGLHKTAGNHDNKIVFLAFDPLSLNSVADFNDPKYIWYGASSSSLQYQTVFNYFGSLVPDMFDAPTPTVSEVTILSNTSSRISREVKAKYSIPNVYYGISFKEILELLYSENGGDFVPLKMQYFGNDYYSAEIPSFEGGTKVTYKVRATIETGVENNPYNIDESETYEYSIDFKTDPKTLVVFNGFETTEGYPQDYYFIQFEDSFGLEDSLYQIFEKIAATSLSIEMANEYDNIFEICSNQPDYDNRAVIKEWISGSSVRNYFLCGQNYFTKSVESCDTTYAFGDFEYDILGITNSRQNINFIGQEGDSITQIIPQQNTILGDALYSHFSNEEYEAVEYRFMLNQIDAFLVAEDNEVFMQAIGKDGANYSVGTSRMLSAGNQVAFMSYDPMLVYSEPDNFAYGTSELSPIVQAVYWFERNVVDVKEESIVTNYSISQNYPNPFNPTTMIKYEVPESNFVKIKVYDILGREVSTLVNKEHRAGSFEVEFNASNLTSGVYFYSIFAGDFKEVKKMLLLK